MWFNLGQCFLWNLDNNELVTGYELGHPVIENKVISPKVNVISSIYVRKKCFLWH